MSFVQNNQLLAVTSASEVGMIEDSSAASLPTGYLYPNGQTVNTADYPELAAARGESGATMVLPAVYPEKVYSEANGDFTVTGSNWTTNYSSMVVYQGSDGTWRMRLNIGGVLSTKASTFTGTIDGTGWDFITISDANIFQTGNGILIENAVAVRETSQVRTQDTTKQFLIDSVSGDFNRISLSFDAEITGKPSFVLANSPANYNTYKVIRYAPKTALQGTYEERPKNYIGNGDMTVCQPHSATATGTDATSGDDVVDRFRLEYSGAMDFYKWQDTSTIPYALVADVQTADSSIAAGDYAMIKHVVEGYDFAPLKDETITVTFDVYGKAGTYCLALQNSDQGYSYITEYTIDSDSTWKTITKNITVDTSSGNWNYSNGFGLRLHWTIATGTTYQTASTNQWVSGTYLGTSNQDNGTAGTGTDYDFKLRNVALYKGSYTAATLPEFRPKNDSFADNLAECQRYWEKSYDYGTDVATATAVGQVFYIDAIYNGVHLFTGDYKVEKRAAPSVSVYDANSNASKCTTYDASGVPTHNQTATISTNGTNRVGVSYNLNAGGIGFHWVADARL